MCVENFSLEEFRNTVIGLHANACYHNAVLQTMALYSAQILKEIERTQDKLYYNEASLILGLPDTTSVLLLALAKSRGSIITGCRAK